MENVAVTETKTKPATKRRSKKAAVELVKDEPEQNVFENPEAALVEGSAAQLAVLDGNQIEAPEEDTVDPELDKELREKIKVLVKRSDDNSWELSEAIATVSNTKRYKTWGYKTFEAYVNAECQIGKRKGQYLVQVYNYFNKTLESILVNKPDLYKEYLESIKAAGWVKARTLASEQIITEHNATEVLEKVKTCSVNDLLVVCNAIRNAIPPKEKEKLEEDNTEKFVKMNLQFTLAQKQDVEAAIDHALTVMKAGATKSSAIAMICRDYISSNVLGEGKEENVANMLSKFERFLGVSLVAVDTEGNKITYGADTLEKLAKE